MNLCKCQLYILTPFLILKSNHFQAIPKNSEISMSSTINIEELFSDYKYMTIHFELVGLLFVYIFEKLG